MAELASGYKEREVLTFYSRNTGTYRRVPLSLISFSTKQTFKFAAIEIHLESRIRSNCNRWNSLPFCSNIAGWRNYFLDACNMTMQKSEKFSVHVCVWRGER